jgi:hypothetical protein
MAKKKLQSGLQLTGIAPNILLTHVENTAPFLFKGELQTSEPNQQHLEKLRFYKKNLKQLKSINLAEYFHICMASHWATAGTFVPTDVDNQIRKTLWEHQSIKKNIDKMARITIDAWKWDFSQVTNRKSYNRSGTAVMSTHEGTWLSVAIGAYCALVKNEKTELAKEMADVILAEIDKEQTIMTELREDRDHINFIKAAPLMAHNFGDLDRVMVQWEMDENDSFYKRIYKLGHQLNENYSPILVYGGQVNKEFTSKENHRHMAIRKPKCLRKSNTLLLPVGPFMDDWGTTLGSTDKLNLAEKAEIVAALFAGFNREEEAFGYCRAFGAMMRELPGGIDSLEEVLAFDAIADIKNSKFNEYASVSKEDFEESYIQRLNDFVCPITGIKF